MIKRDSLFFFSRRFSSYAKLEPLLVSNARARARILLAHFDQRPDDFPFSRGPSNRFRDVISRISRTETPSEFYSRLW